LFVIRKAIIDYTLDKEKAPQSLQDLINEHYLREVPTDPFTGNKDWVSVGDTTLGPGGIATVHSASGQVGSNRSAYDTW